MADSILDRFKEADEVEASVDTSKKQVFQERDSFASSNSKTQMSTI